jgi:hypothetical protein
MTCMTGEQQHLRFAKFVGAARNDVSHVGSVRRRARLGVGAEAPGPSTSTAMTAVKNIVNATPSLRLNSPTRTQKAQMRPTSTRLTPPAITPRRAAWMGRRDEACRALGVRRRLAAYRVGVGTGRWFVVDGHRVDSTARAWVFPLRVRLRRRGVAESVV